MNGAQCSSNGDRRVSVSEKGTQCNSNDDKRVSVSEKGIQYSSNGDRKVSASVNGERKVSTSANGAQCSSNDARKVSTSANGAQCSSNDARKVSTSANGAQCSSNNARKVSTSVNDARKVSTSANGAQCSSNDEMKVSVRWNRSRLVELYIDTVTGGFERDGNLVKVMVTFGKEVVDISQKVLQAVKEAGNEEIQAIYQVKDALHHLTLVVEAAYEFLDKVDDIFYYCQSDLMKGAIRKLSCSPPDLNPLRDLLTLFGNSLKMAESKYSELVKACNVSSQSCREAAEKCACKVIDSQNKKGVTRGVGGTAAGVTLAGGTAAAAGGIVAGGVAISAVAGAFTFGIGTIVGLAVTAVAAGGVGLGGLATGVGTAVATHRIAKKFQGSEDNFRRIGAKFDALLGFAYDLKEGVAQVHTTQVNISANVDNVKDSTDKENIALIKETLKRLQKACSDTYATTSECRDEVKSKMEELKSKVK